MGAEGQERDEGRKVEAQLHEWGKREWVDTEGAGEGKRSLLAKESVYFFHLLVFFSGDDILTRIGRGAVGRSEEALRRWMRSKDGYWIRVALDPAGPIMDDKGGAVADGSVRAELSTRAAGVIVFGE